MAIQLRHHRFSVEQFHQMAETGVLNEDDRVELIDGEIIQMTPIGVRHAAVMARVTRVCIETIGRLAFTSPQNPLLIDEYGEPQPDVTLLRPRADDYESTRPTGADTLLVVEVSDSSLEYDRQVKLPIYARATIPEAWIVDLTRDVVEVHTDPGVDGYLSVRIVRRGESIQPVSFPGVEISSDVILRGRGNPGH